MNLENMIPSERHKGPQIVRFHLHKMSTIGKSIEMGSKGLPNDGMRVGEGVVILMCMGFFWGGDENSAKLTVMVVARICEYKKNYTIVHFK